jgi:hypothetical protein
MIETLILGFIIGMICTGAGATYAACKFLNEPYFIKKFHSGYSVLSCDIGTEGDPNGYIGVKKNGNLIAGIKFNKEGITDIVYDI